MLNLQDFSRLTYGENGNLTAWGHTLYEFLQSDEQLSLLNGYGWLDGGCMVLARALHAWSPQELEIVAWCPGEQTEPDPSSLCVQHYAVAMAGGPLGKILVDGDGLSSEEDFRRKMGFELWEENDHKGYFHPNPKRLIELDVRGENAADITSRGMEPVIAELAKRLRMRFGEFDSSLILGQLVTRQEKSPDEADSFQADSQWGSRSNRQAA